MTKTTKAKKPIDHSTSELERAKNVFWDYYDVFTLREKPINDNNLEKIAQDLVSWAINDDDAWKLSQFFHKRGIGSTVIKLWRARNKQFDEAYKFTMEVLGNKREIGAMKKQLDAGIVSSSMAIYDPEWKELAEWKAKLAQKDADAMGNVQIIMEAYPTPQIVLDKKKQVKKLDVE